MLFTFAVAAFAFPREWSAERTPGELYFFSLCVLENTVILWYHFFPLIILSLHAARQITSLEETLSDISELGESRRST